MLELIKERWNNLPAAERKKVVVLILPALVLITFSFMGLMVFGGPSRHHLDQAPVEANRQTIELEPKLLEKSEMLEKDKQLQALSKEMNEVLKKSGQISAAPTKSHNLPLNRETGDGKTLLAEAHEELSSPDTKIFSMFFWIFGLLCGLVAVAAICRKPGFITGEHSSVGMRKGLKGSPQAYGPDNRGSLPDTSDILREREKADYSCGPERKRTGEPDWPLWMRSVDPWSGSSWEQLKLADGASLTELTEMVLETADRKSHPSMRFYLSTVLKAHMFLQDRLVSSSGKKIPYIRFDNSLVRFFYEFCFRHGVDFETDSGSVISEILKLLDEYGDCPSVARLASDRESRLDGRIHARLREIPLWRHSVNVANRLAGSCRYRGEPLSQLLIASLAHDLGNMPHVNRTEAESHAQAGVRVLKSISGFSTLPYAGDIRKAIREHHDSCPTTPLGRKLRDADSLARRFELAADSIFEHESWEMWSCAEEISEPTMKNVCLAIYPYFMHFTELESLRDCLTVYERSAELVRDLERILRQPQYLFNDAFKVGAAIAEIAGATLEAKNRL